MIGTGGGDPQRLLSSVQTNVLGAFDAIPKGGLRYTDGKAPHAYVYGWSQAGQMVSWPARLNKPAEFEVWAKYSTGTPQSGGRFAVEIGKQRLEADVVPTDKDTDAREVNLGLLR